MSASSGKLLSCYLAVLQNNTCNKIELEPFSKQETDQYNPSI